MGFCIGHYRSELTRPEEDSPRQPRTLTIKISYKMIGKKEIPAFGKRLIELFQSQKILDIDGKPFIISEIQRHDNDACWAKPSFSGDEFSGYIIKLQEVRVVEAKRR